MAFFIAKQNVSFRVIFACKLSFFIKTKKNFIQFSEQQCAYEKNFYILYQNFITHCIFKKLLTSNELY